MTTVVNAIILLTNLGVLALTIKLYTELFKDKAFDKRAKGRLPEEEMGTEGKWTP